MKSTFSPIIIFAFNRPDKLQNLLYSLNENEELKFSELHFYIDKASNTSDIKKNNEVIYIANNVKTAKKVKVNIAKNNLGLKENILNGINKTFEEYEDAIFLEDDLIVGKYFLNYMNNALIKYKNKKEIFHISGYNFPNNSIKNNKSYFTYLMNCWGWATWKDRWELNKNFSENKITKLNKLQKIKFNIYNFEKDFEFQLVKNDNKKIKTWAIYWYQFIYLSKGLCLNPVNSLVQNNGIDGSGTHKSISNLYNVNLNQNKITDFPERLNLNFKYLIKMIFFYRNKNKNKIYSALKKLPE